MKGNVKRLICLILTLAMVVPSGITLSFAADETQSQQAAPIPVYENKDYIVRFDAPAEDSIDGWKNASLPIGNGYMGVNIFGGVEYDRLQVTEQSMFTSGSSYVSSRYSAGQESFADVYIDTAHTADAAENYSRTLRLNDGIANVSYTYDGVDYTREYFSSYPDKVSVVKLTASGEGNLNFTLRPTISYERDSFEEANNIDESGKRGTVVAEGDTITMKGHSEYYSIDFEAQFKVVTDGGEMTAENGTDDEGNTDNGTITVSGANSAYIYFAVGTNYELTSSTFTAARADKISGNAHPHDKVTGYMTAASVYSYDELKARHSEDVLSYFNRNVFDIGGADDGRTTAELITSYKAGTQEKYLEELYYQMGRYMMIASSREGTLPPGLQGIWNAYLIAPWTAGFWYNVNQQMNYWPVFSTNLGDLYKAYSDFNLARLPQAETNGSTYIKKYRADQYEEGDGNNGWIVGTGNSAYTVAGVSAGGHSGPGTGGFTAISDIDYYRFTNDTETLSAVYPIIESLARFYSKCVDNYDGLYLATISASPENKHNGAVYPALGCAFDQQMIYETNKAVIDIYDEYKDVLENPDTELIETLRAQVDYYDHVIIGLSGQVKEYREEDYYGDIGEYTHRHISQLVGLYPGTSINDETPAWVDGAKVTLRERGLDTGTGWSVAHKLGMWARTGDGETSYSLVQGLINKHLFDNLWNCHDTRTASNLSTIVFQAEGNFGGTAGIAEMLLQSHGEYIKVLPAVPSAWADGSFKGLVARGNFAVSADWTDSIASEIEVISNAGGTLKLNYYNIANATVTKNGEAVTPATSNKDHIEIETVAGDVIVVTNIPSYTVTADVSDVVADEAGNDATVTWTASSDEGAVYNVYRAFESEPTYELMTTTADTSYTDTTRAGRQATYKITAISDGSEESLGGTSTVIPTAGAVEEIIAFMADDTHLQLQWEVPENAYSFKIYEKTADGYSLLLETEEAICIIENASADKTYAISAVFYDTESEIKDITIGEIGDNVSKLELYNYIAEVKALYNEGFTDEDLATIEADIAAVEAVWYDTAATEEEVAAAVSLAQEVLETSSYFVKNVVLGKTAVLGSGITVNPDYPISDMTDGDTNTRMATSSGARSELVFEIDLEEAYTISTFTLIDFRDGNGSRGDNVTVEGLLSNGKWITMATAGDEIIDYTYSGGKRTIDMTSTISLPVSALRVTMTDTDSAQKDMSIWEFKAIGALPDSRPQISGLAFNENKPATGSIVLAENIDNGDYFYSDRDTFTMAHLGSALKGKTQIRLPVNDSTRAKNAELNTFLQGDNTYFSFSANSDGKIYVAFTKELPNLTAERGWSKVSSSEPALPDGITDIKNLEYTYEFTENPYYATKFQWNSAATINTESANIGYADRRDTVYEKSFSAYETVEVPTIGFETNENYFVVVDLNGENTNSELDYIFYGDQMAKAESGKYEYEFEVDPATETVDLSALAKSSSATVELSAETLTFTNGIATATVKVTSGENVSEYTLSFKKLTNVALNKSITVEPTSLAQAGSYGSFSNEAIVDGSFDAATGRYYSGARSNIVAEIDLGAVYDIEYMNVSEFRGGAPMRTDNLMVEAYNDGAWTTVVSGEALDGALTGTLYSTTRFDFSERVRAKKLRLTFKNSGYDNGETAVDSVYPTAQTSSKDISIVEVEAYGVYVESGVNPSTDLGMIYVGGEELSGFSADTHEYTVYTKDDSVEVYGEAVSYDATVSDKVTVDMSSGRGSVNIIVTGATGEASTYVVNVIKTTNVVLNKSLTTTPTANANYPAANIVDGDFSTRYYGGGSAYCPVVEIDLGGEHTITDFVVSEFRYPADFPMRINNLMIYAYVDGEYKLIKSGVALDGEVVSNSSRTYITLDEPVSGVSKLKFDLQNLGYVNGETATNSITVGSQTTYIYDVSGTSKRDCSICEIQAFGVSESECIEVYPISDTYDKAVISDDNGETYYEAEVDFSTETAYAVFDTAAYTDIETILATPRSYSDGEEYYFDRPVGYTVYTSDDNLTFTQVKSGEITYDDFNDFDTKTIALDSAVNAKYIKLEITSVYGARSDEKTYFSLAEVGFGVAGEVIIEPLDGMQFYNIRDGFSNSYIKFNEKETATVAFLGGSITSANGYRVNLMNYLKEKFPDTTFTFINAGIPSTDSTMGAFRLDKDILSKGEVDLLFVEFAVNDEDNARSETESIKGMEGIIRHAYETNPYMDIMVMHFSDPTKHSQYSATEEHTMPVIDAQEMAVSHYSVTSLDLAKEVSARIANGELTWEEFGGKHPSAAGHKIYSDGVVAVLEKSWESVASEKTEKVLPEKLNENSYTNGRYEDISGAVLTNGFTYVESWAPADGVSTRDGFVNVPMLESTSTDVSLTYTFTGTDLGILLPAGPDVGYITYSIDGGEEQSQNLFTNWSKSLHIPWVYMLATELDYGEHTITINASETADSRSTGNAVRIQSFLVNGEILEVTSPIERDLHQRNDENEATFTVSGNTTADSVEISATRMEGYSAGADMAAVTADVTDGKFEKDITLAGGYYKVTVKAIKDGEVIATEEVDRVGVGEIFITAGQSNSASFSQDETSASDDRVSSYDYANGKWVFAEDPQVSLGDANEFTSWGNGDGETRSGGSVWPSLGDILTAELDVPVGFINIGIGSSVVSSWNGSLYSRMQRAVTAFGVNGVRAVLWHQGENDSRAGTTTEDYKTALTSVIEKSREDAGWDIPWVVSIAAYHNNEESTAENQEMIRAAQRAVIAEVEGVYEGPYTDDMLGDLRDSTKVHFSLAGLKEFAARWWVSLENAFFMGEYPVSVTSGENITAYINGGEAQNWGTLKTESYLMGTEFTLSVEDNGTNKFMYWQDALSGKIVSYSKEYSFVLGSVKNIRAVFADSEVGALITFKGMGDVVYASAYNDVTVPENPYLMGYEFIGWYDELTQTDLGIKAGESFTSDTNLSIKAGWKIDDTMYSVEVVGANEQSTSYKYNSKVSLTAKETDENGNAFSYWMRDGNVVSYEKNYSFYVSSATKVEAVYGQSAEAKVIITMANPVLVDTSKIAFFAERLVPEEYTVIETGILMSDAADVSLDSYKYKAIAKSTLNKGQYTVRKKDVSSGETWYGAAYVIYRDGDGTLYTAYSNEVSYTVE